MVATPQVGTIFGVWPGDKLKGITGRDQAAAGMGVFGPRTCFVIALKDAPGCHEFLLQVPRAVHSGCEPSEADPALSGRFSRTEQRNGGSLGGKRKRVRKLTH